MRWVLVSGVALALGCTDGIAPPNLLNNNDDMDVGDLADEDQGMDAGAEDLRPPPSGDIGPDLLPQSCSTACDCPAGQSCSNGSCAMMPMIFCCGAASCTGSSTCETSDGRFSQCSAPPDAGVRPDAGSSATCASVACTPGTGGNVLCRLACTNLTATCSGATGHCMP